MIILHEFIIDSRTFSALLSCCLLLAVDCRRGGRKQKSRQRSRSGVVSGDSSDVQNEESRKPVVLDNMSVTVEDGMQFSDEGMNDVSFLDDQHTCQVMSKTLTGGIFKILQA